MHENIILSVVFVIVVLQLFLFIKNYKNIVIYKNIFPSNSKIIERALAGNCNIIYSSHNNPIFDNIRNSLNNYLMSNNGAISDYHLMKDIIDRNCDSKEEEISSLSPVPLYLGLAGTMFGILFGIGFLVYTGGLKDLISTGQAISDKGSTGINGIETLLGGVALAMISSIFGIVLTTISSYITNLVKVKVEKNKNIFLSWIQSELLPNISTDTSSALVKMTKNLLSFNNSFSVNTEKMNNLLVKISESFRNEKELMESINRLKIHDIATANINVYEKLKNCTTEIDNLTTVLYSSNEYLTTLQTLNEKLDKYERRTQIIESAGKFYSKNEKWLSENMDIANLELQNSFKRFVENTKSQLSQMNDSFNSQLIVIDNLAKTQHEAALNNISLLSDTLQKSVTKILDSFNTATDRQYNALNNQSKELTLVIEEIRNLKHIKEGIKGFRDETIKQNRRIEDLVKSINELALAKNSSNEIKQILKFPKWIKISVITTCLLISIASLLYTIPLIVNVIRIIF